MSPTYQRAILLPAAVLAVATVGTAGARASTLVVRGAGFGHGVGMSQEGALGFARHGYDYRGTLAHYFTATSVGATAAASQVLILLQGNRGRASIAGADRVNGHRLSLAVTYTVALAPGRRVAMRADSHTIVTAPLLRFTGPATVRLRGTADNGVRSGLYRGALEIRPALHGGLNAIDAINVEDYVRGVVAEEMPASWPPTALQAQAVASRSYALASHDGPGSGFGLYADTRSQLYRGVAGETRRTDAAVAATAGQVVTYAGHPVVTYFFASSGGRTENVENAFPGAAPQPWLRGVDDPFDGGSLHHWGPVRLSFAAAAARLAGLVRGAFTGIEVLRRGFSPRIVSAYVLGSRGPTRVSGTELAARLGLYDSWAHFSVDDGRGGRPEPDRSAAPAAGAPPMAPSPLAPSGGTPG